MRDSWEHLAAEIIARAIQEYRGTWYTGSGEKRRRCSHCSSLFYFRHSSHHYCSRKCWEQSRQELDAFFAGSWFEELADFAGVHPETVRDNLEMPEMPASWRPVEVDAWR